MSGTTVAPSTTARAMKPEALAAMQQRIADTAVVADIESNAFSVTVDQERWCDLRPMLDEREVSPECIDMTREALAYGIARGLLRQHPAHEHLVQVLRRPA